MSDIERERLDLEMNERHPKEGRARVRRQIALVRELHDDGHDTELARKLLAALRDSVAVARQHRALVLGLLIDHTHSRPAAIAAHAGPVVPQPDEPQ